jgi:hypothetical protein
MDIKKIKQSILKYNPLNLNKDDISFYETIYDKIKIITNLTVDNLQNIFIEHFGESRVLFEMRNNICIYNNILNELKK